MRNLYLVRHGRVDFPDDIRRCIGWTDLPLDQRGRKQAKELGVCFCHMTRQQVPVFSSPLIRARETAQLLAKDNTAVRVDEGLKEFYMGEWENVPMNQLKKTLESWPEAGESRESGLIRMKETIGRILAWTTGDVICVAHGGLNSCFLAHLLGISLDTSRSLPQPYGGFSRVQVDEQGHMEVKELGIMPKAAPDYEECLDIWNHYRTPDRVRGHCQAVCRQAERLAKKLIDSGRNLDFQLVRSGALLHDVARAEKAHAERGAHVLRREGYPAVADVIRRHHDLECPCSSGLPDEPLWLETAVVYLADKMVEEDRVVALERRFADSRERCRMAANPEEALTAHERRYRQARKIEKIIQTEIDGGKRI